ncbi:MAG TPA: ATP-binding cassette domain-containing protein [Candidatus Acidoferrales bacterium]|nr:ATP-binding cassette domain-containing protein [Candidatus Acidoferrales bacterium]
MQPAVQTLDITKRFGDLTAVNKINFTIDTREIFGLIGPNGAGKTTLIRMLTTVIPPTEGTAKIAGSDIIHEQDQVRRSIGVVSQATTLDVELTAWENMNIYAKYYGVPAESRKDRIKELLDVVGLGDRASFTVGSYSGGMKRRLELVRSLIHSPKVLFLDEPTTGLDPQARSAVWEYLRGLHERQEITVVITTHYLEEAEALCDRVAIVDYGKIMALGTPTELKRKVMGGDVVEAEVAALPNQALEALKSSKIALDVKKRENILTVLVKSGAEAVPQIVELVSSNGGKIRTMTLREPTLDDVFLNFTGRSIREDTAVTNKRFVSSWGR